VSYVGRRGRTRSQGNDAIGSGHQSRQHETRGCTNFESVGSQLPLLIARWLSLVASVTEKR
jgi:hypothetical protein